MVKHLPIGAIFTIVEVINKLVELGYFPDT